MHRRLQLLIVALAVLPAWPAVPALARPDVAQPSGGTGFAYSPETGHNVGLAIKRFYDSHGGIDIFGLPLTEVFDEDGVRVQYFERARFDLHPELPPDFYVSLSLLGRHFTQGRAEPAFQWLAAAPAGDRTFFPDSGHSLGGAGGEQRVRRSLCQRGQGRQQQGGENHLLHGGFPHCLAPASASKLCMP